MKAIDLTQALINANDVTITKVDALVETSVLKQLIESCKAREKDEHKKQSAKLTMEMKTILDAYPKDHPNIIPDGITRTLKCID